MEPVTQPLSPLNLESAWQGSGDLCFLPGSTGHEGVNYRCTPKRSLS